MSTLTPADVQWTDDDAAEAAREGWGLFDGVENSPRGPFQIQKFDDLTAWDMAPFPYPFRKDTDVWVYIMSNDTPLHRHVLDVLQEVNPDEYLAMVEWLASH